MTKKTFNVVLKEKNIRIFQPKKKIMLQKRLGGICKGPKDTDKKRALSGEIHMFCMDLQAVKLCSTLKAIYYKTKLGNHNFIMYITWQSNKLPVIAFLK